MIVSVWNTPHGIPHRISATCKCTTVCAVKKIAVNAMISVRHVMTVYRYPNLSLTYPLIKSPMISPTFAPLDKPACQGAGICQDPSGNCLPYFLPHISL